MGRTVRRGLTVVVAAACLVAAAVVLSGPATSDPASRVDPAAVSRAGATAHVSNGAVQVRTPHVAKRPHSAPDTWRPVLVPGATAVGVALATGLSWVLQGEAGARPALLRRRNCLSLRGPPQPSLA